MIEFIINIYLLSGSQKRRVQLTAVACFRVEYSNVTGTLLLNLWFKSIVQGPVQCNTIFEDVIEYSSRYQLVDNNEVDSGY